MEEYVARNITNDDCLFCWQVEPSVVIGRNQLIANEVNVDYCREHGIQVFRRKSGGGCIYADKGNVMFSFITDGGNVGFAFNRYIGMMVLMLRRLGADASATGRNDILVGGKKVSGNAFYHLPGRSIVHGTMLYDTDMENMLKSITPTGDKLESKGVGSVRQRITLLKDHINAGMEELKAYMKANLCDDRHALTADDVRKIEELERETYLSPGFIQGNNPRHVLTRMRRIDGVGGIEAHIDMKGDTIKNIALSGDFFTTGDVDKAILDCLRNVRLDKNDIAKALPEELEGVIMNLRKADFVSLLTDD